MAMPSKKSKVVNDSPPYLFVWEFFPPCSLMFLFPVIHFFCLVLIRCSLMFPFASFHFWSLFSILMWKWLGPYPLIHLYWCVMLLCYIVLLFGHVLVSTCWGVNVQIQLVVHVQPCPMVIKRQHPWLPRKLNVVIDSPPYPFIWVFFSPMLSYPAISYYLFVWIYFY